MNEALKGTKIDKAPGFAGIRIHLKFLIQFGKVVLLKTVKPPELTLSYRSFALSSVMYKGLGRLLYNRMLEIISVEKDGFHSGHSCTDY